MARITWITLIALLAGSSSAFPGMGRGRREALLQAREASPEAFAEAEPEPEAATSASSSSYPAWKPAQPGEVRSPCPGLNTLANHNICPRSGRGYTIPVLNDCLAKGFNIGSDFSVAIGTMGIGSNPVPTLLYFDLDMLDRHNVFIEHDASLSRADASTGNNYAFNQAIWNTVLQYYDGMENATIPVAAKAKFNRVKTENARDPAFTYGPLQFVLSYGETALYLSTMGDPTTGVAPIKYVRSLFEKEKLPYDLGWRPPVQPTTLNSLGQMVVELNLANGEPVPEGLILGSKSLGAVLIGLDGVTGAVSNSVLYAIAKLTGAAQMLGYQ